MKIIRTDLYRLNIYDDYIEKNSSFVEKVCGQTIYFKNGHKGHMTYLTWDYDEMPRYVEDLFLKIINSACNTEFEFID